MVEALDNQVGAKIVPSRDHGRFIDGSLSLDSERVRWMAAAAALGLGCVKTHPRAIAIEWTFHKAAFRCAGICERI
jgi:hypothetical protein